MWSWLSKDKYMEFVDLKAQQDQIKPELNRRIAEVLAHGRYIMGPEISELEKRLQFLY